MFAHVRNALDLVIGSDVTNPSSTCDMCSLLLLMARRCSINAELCKSDVVEGDHDAAVSKPASFAHLLMSLFRLVLAKTLSLSLQRTSTLGKLILM